jgi:pimeloyl-ACP methyl ester carboxylesterase
VVLLERTGHYPQLERPAEVLAAYLDFADRVASMRATS